MPTAGVPTSRFLSEDDCRRIAAIVTGSMSGGGQVQIGIYSQWQSTVRWAKNAITDSTDVRTNGLSIRRANRDRWCDAITNQIDEVFLRDLVRRSERLLAVAPVRGPSGSERATLFPDDPYPRSRIWSDVTYRLDAATRAATARQLVAPSVTAGMDSFGYIETEAYGKSFVDTRGRLLYYPATKATYRVTVRDPAGTGSGWAGQTFSDWNRIDTAKLSTTALDKCLRSRNPVVIEPGRYTVILEPQAVYDLVVRLFNSVAFSRLFRGKIGQRVMDARLTVSQDPLDPDIDIFPFTADGEPLRATTWIDEGIVRALPYSRHEAVINLGRDAGQPFAEGIRMSGGESSLDAMIASTKRGLLVTRFSNMSEVDPASLLLTGYTRDGLWLVENGAITKPVKNLRFTESPLFMLNNIDHLGSPVRVWGDFVVPPIKAHDFSFTALTDAV